jgi:phosphate uptake regulator
MPGPGIKRPMRTSNEVNETVSELSEKFDKLEARVEKMCDAMIVLADVMKLLTFKIYGGTPDESAQQILDRTEKMVDSWK